MSTPIRPAADAPASRQAQRLALQGLVNVVIRSVLRTPVLCRLAGKRLITVYVVGRKSGRRYAIPVAYTRHHGSLLVGTPFRWVRNLRSGEAVNVRLMGKRRLADVRMISDEAGVVEHYDILVRDNHAFARLNKIELDHAGNPRLADIHQAWANGARVIQLTPR